jgi:hypothetical protein
MKKTIALTPERIMQLSWGYAPPLILEAAVKHRVFDLLDQSPKTAQQLAAKTGASMRSSDCNFWRVPATVTNSRPKARHFSSPQNWRFTAHFLNTFPNN